MRAGGAGIAVIELFEQGDGFGFLVSGGGPLKHGAPGDIDERGALRGATAAGDEPGYATIEDTMAGMHFLRASLESSRRGAVWVDLSEGMTP